MDLSFFRTLQSIKDMEEKPPFKSEDIDLATFTATYPDVIIVDQTLKDGVDLDSNGFVAVPEKEFTVNHAPALRSGPFARIELHTNSISRAFGIVTHTAVRLGLKKSSRSALRSPCWTVILKEGLYIDPDMLLWSPAVAKLDDVAIEIVGMKGARILFLQKNRNPAGNPEFQYVTATLRNVIIHDRRDDIPLDGSTYRRNEHHNLLKASVEAKLTLKNCLLTGCILTSLKDTLVTAVNTHFIACPRILLKHKSRCVIQNCHIDCRVSIHHDGTRTGNFPLFDVYPGAFLLCQKSVVWGYGKVVDAQGSGTEVTLEDNRFTVWDCIGEIKENASVRVLRNYIHSPFLLIIMLNVSGKIELKENELSKCGCTTAEFDIDKYSTKPITDIDGVTYDQHEFNAAYFKQHSKQRSAYTKSFKREQMKKQADGLKPEFHTSPTLYKRCQTCFKSENDEVLKQWAFGQAARPSRSTKLQYCARCHVVCYCSKECQMKNWPDHKLACAMYCAANEEEELKDADGAEKENVDGVQRSKDAANDNVGGGIGHGKGTKTKTQRKKEPAGKGKGGRKKMK